ncbi:L-seryl-tRNA(Sec) selenium transferase, partial [bacterium]|nr:L-seryl-tRNA(Sec) selenium transferase [bacterium]
IYDQGSGLVDSHEWSGDASTIRGAIEAGCDLISFSGDKLLGGPQAGIVIGRDELVAACVKHPLARAFRLDKVILAGLAATLDSYRDGRAEELSTLRLLAQSRDELHQRAENLAEKLRDAVPDGFSLSVVKTMGRAGSGALPMVDFPGTALSFSHKRISVIRGLAQELRLGGIFGRLTGTELLLDPRALPEDEESEFLAALKVVLAGL